MLFAEDQGEGSKIHRKASEQLRPARDEVGNRVMHQGTGRLDVKLLDQLGGGGVVQK